MFIVVEEAVQDPVQEELPDGLEVDDAVVSKIDFERGKEKICKGDVGTVKGTSKDPDQPSRVNIDFPTMKGVNLLPSQFDKVDRKLDNLKKDVMDFTDRGVEGVLCTILRERSLERLAGSYCLEENAKYIIFLSGDTLQTEELIMPVKELVNVFTLETDGENCFPPAILGILEPGEAERLIMLGFSTKGSDKKTRFCFLETDREARDTFARCMKVLSVYAQILVSE
jgi:hypothetical protein